MFSFSYKYKINKRYYTLNKITNPSVISKQNNMPSSSLKNQSKFKNYTFQYRAILLYPYFLYLTIFSITLIKYADTHYSMH